MVMIRLRDGPTIGLAPERVGLVLDKLQDDARYDGALSMYAQLSAHARRRPQPSHPLEVTRSEGRALERALAALGLT
jgi:hypothetical protein